MAPDLVITCDHVLGSGTSFTIDGSPVGPDQVVVRDAGLDIAALRTNRTSEHFLSLSNDPVEARVYAFIARSNDGWETGAATPEGYRAKGSNREIKFSNVQVQPGFSGSPLIDMQTGRVHGVVSITRSLRTDLGGYAVPVASFLERVERESDRDLRTTTTGSWNPLTKLPTKPVDELTIAPLRGAPFFERSKELALLLENVSPGQLCIVSGPSGVGKKALATSWLYSSKPYLEGGRAFLILDLLNTQDYPVLRSIQHQLKITLVPDELGKRTQEETATLIRWEVSQRLHGVSAVLAWSKESSVLTHDVLSFVESKALQGASVIFAVRSPPDELSHRVDVTLALGPFSVDEGARLLQTAFQRSNIGADDWQAAVSLLTPDHLLPSRFLEFERLRQVQVLDPLDVIDHLLDGSRVAKPARSQGLEQLASDGPASDLDLTEANFVLNMLDHLDEPEARQYANAIEHEVLRATISDDLGPQLAARQRTSDEYLLWLGRLRGTRSMWDIRKACASVPHGAIGDVDLLQAMRVELSRLDRVYDFVEDIEQARTSLIENLSTRIATSAPARWLLADSCLARLLLGAPWNPVEPLASLRGLGGGDGDAALEARIIMLDTCATRRALGPEFLASLARIEAAGGKETAVSLAVEHLHLGSNLIMDPPGLVELSEFVRDRVLGTKWDNVHTFGVFTNAIAVLSTYYDRVLPRAELLEILEESVTTLSRHRDKLRSLATFGDNRPALTLARQLRRYGRALLASGEIEAKEVLANAESEFAWITRNAPSPGAWLSRFSLTFARGTHEDVELFEGLHSTDLRSFRAMVAEYNAWKAGALSNARSVEIEYLIVTRFWRYEGSILKAAMKSLERWAGPTLGHQLGAAQSVFESRMAALRRIGDAVGPNPRGLVHAVRLADEYSGAVALINRSEPDYDLGDRLLTDGLAEFGDVALILLEQCRRLRHRRFLPEAAESYRVLLARVGADELIDSACRIGLAETQLQLSSLGGLSSEAELSAAAELVEPLVRSSAHASMHWLGAQLELQDGQLPHGVTILRDLFEDRRGYTWVASADQHRFREALSELGDEIFDLCPKQVASDFTSPGLLVQFGAYLTRAYLLRPDNGTKTLVAALNCFDGARIMTQGSVSPVLEFHLGMALMIGSRVQETDEGLNWARANGFKYPSDKAMAEAKLQAAVDRSVGRFRSLCAAYLQAPNEIAPRLSRDDFKQRMGKVDPRP